MLIEQTIENMKALGLSSMVNALRQQLAQPKSYEISFEDRLALLIDEEIISRKNKKLSRLLKAAKFKHDASLEDVEYNPQRGITKEQINALINCHFINDGLNLIITGPTGTGKSWLACAFGKQACYRGLSALYIRFNRLLEKIRLSRADGTYAKFVKSLAKIDLLIVDDWLLEPLEHSYRHDILDIIEDRHQQKSILLNSQMPIEHWHKMIGDPTVADAILDRLISQSIRFELKGESMRKKRNFFDAS